MKYVYEEPRRRRTGRGPFLVLLAFVTGAAAMTPLRRASDPDETAVRLRNTEQQLTARRGELELVRIELGRLHAVHQMSRQHRIPADLAADIYDVAKAEGIEPKLAFSLVRIESGFSRFAISSKGAVGLTQLMPSTATFVDPGVSYGELFDRKTNLRIGFRYLHRLIEQYEGNLDLALHAYNRGPTRVDSIRARGGDPANGYARAVLGSP